MSEELDRTIDENPKVIGEFKPKRKFLNFVSGVNGTKIRLIQEHAYLNGSKLSGALDGAKFKLTICDDGTINFEEVDTNLADKAMISRLIDDIDLMDVTGYTGKFIISELKFEDENGRLCYLEVEHLKPIDKLKSLFDDDVRKEVSDKGLSILDELFGSNSGSNSEDIDEVIDDKIEFLESVESDNKPSFLEEQFAKIKLDKVNELKERIESSNIEISRHKREIKISESKVKDLNENLEVLRTRLESLNPISQPNGWVFSISEEQKSEVEIDDKSKSIADKISDMLGLKKDVVLKNLTDSFYKIKVSKEDNLTTDINDVKSIISDITNIDPLGSFDIVGDDIIYKGELNWHKLVDRMIKAGFSQNSEFDKICLSNSYDINKGSQLNIN